MIIYRNSFEINISSKVNLLKKKNIYLKVQSTLNELASIYSIKYFSMGYFLAILSVIFLVSYIFFYNIFLSVIPTTLMSMFIVIIPYSILVYILKKHRKKILKFFPTFILSLKNYTDIDNNIINAFAKVEKNNAIGKNIEKFCISVESGIDVYSSFETLKQDINIEEISHFITLLQNCYLNGGNFSVVIDKFSKYQTKRNIEKEKINDNLLGNKIILIVLVVLSIFMLFGFALKNNDYRNIILFTTGGKVVLSFNILSYFLMYYIYIKLVKMEE